MAGEHPNLHPKNSIAFKCRIMKDLEPMGGIEPSRLTLRLIGGNVCRLIKRKSSTTSLVRFHYTVTDTFTDRSLKSRSMVPITGKSL